MTAVLNDQPSNAHTRLGTPAFLELRAWAVDGRLDLDLLLGHDVFNMRGVSLKAATQMFSAQVWGGAHPEFEYLPPDHVGLISLRAGKMLHVEVLALLVRGLEI